MVQVTLKSVSLHQLFKESFKWINWTQEKVYIHTQKANMDTPKSPFSKKKIMFRNIILEVQASFPGQRVVLTSEPRESVQNKQAPVLQTELSYTFVIVPYSESNQWLTEYILLLKKQPRIRIKSTFLLSHCSFHLQNEYYADPPKTSLPKIHKPSKGFKKKNSDFDHSLDLPTTQDSSAK